MFNTVKILMNSDLSLDFTHFISSYHYWRLVPFFFFLGGGGAQQSAQFIGMGLAVSYAPSLY